MKQRILWHIYLIALFSMCGFVGIMNATDVRIRSQIWNPTFTIFPSITKVSEDFVR